MAVNGISFDELAGITVKNYREIRAAMETDMQTLFPGISTNPGDPDGMLLDIFAFAYTECAQAMQRIIAQMDVAQANGAGLDHIGAIMGVHRIQGESDEEYRRKLNEATITGYATFNGLLTALRSTISNDITLVEDLIAHNISVYVPDTITGRENEIAQAIFDYRPAGIPSEGTETGTAVDTQGEQHIEKFTYVSKVDYDLKIIVHPYSEESLPEDYVERIKAAVAAWALGEYTPGKDIIPQRVSTPIYQNVEGVEYVEVSSRLHGTQEWSTQKVSIPLSQIVQVLAENVEVE